MDSGCSPRQPAAACELNWQSPEERRNILSRPSIHSSSNSPKLTALKEVGDGPQAGTGNGCLFVLCSSCGQVSHSLNTCDFCSKPIAVGTKIKQTVGHQRPHPKRRLDLVTTCTTTTTAQAEVGPKIAKRTFYGSRVTSQTASNAVTILHNSVQHVTTGNNRGVQCVGTSTTTTNGQALLVVPVAGRSLLTLSAGHTPVPPTRVNRTGRRGKREPECLTISISSDDEEMDVECQDTSAKDEGAIQGAGRDDATPPREVQCLTETPKTPSRVPALLPSSALSPEVHRVVGLPGSPTTVVDSSGRLGRVRAALGSPPPLRVSFQCRSIRVGSYKVAGGDHRVSVTSRGFEFSLRTVVPNDAKQVDILLGVTDVTQVLGHLSRNMPVLYVTTTRECSMALREKLGMSRKLPCYFDPNGTDERQKRITFLPDPSFTDEHKAFLRQVFPGPLMEEINQTVANEILIKSSPSPMMGTSFSTCLVSKPLPSQVSNDAVAVSGTTSVTQQVTSSGTPTHIVIHNLPANTAVVPRTRAASASMASNCVSSTSAQGSPCAEVPSGPNIKLLVYPPPPKTGGIAVHSADLRCLGEAQFLNDVIIDFYLKYLMLEKVSEEVRQRTHVFSSFFYPRLTQRLHTRAPGQAGLSAAARRHRNVRTWTRHVDIFEKEFIVVPINQNSHWFLAMVCFPGLVARTCPPQEVPQEEKAALAAYQSPAASPKVVEDKAGPDSTQDDGENLLDSEPEESQEPEDPESGTPKSNDTSVETAYILILDSLRGGQDNKCRIMSTLREYLSEEWKAKKKTQLSFCYSNMRGYTPMTPQQGNYSDCGVYLLQYVESFLENPPAHGKLLKKDLGDWFPEDRVGQKRGDIRDLILRLHMQQKPGSDFPARWRKEEAAIAAQQCLQVSPPSSSDDQVTTVPTTTTTTVILSPVTQTIVLVCPSTQPSSVS